MTFLEKHMLRHGHPRHMIVAVVSTIWATYFFWKHELALALWVMLGGMVLARLATLGMREEQFAQTTFGKILLLHLHPLNMLLQVTGFVLFMYGVWEHNALNMMVGTSLIFAGHFWGWHKVNEAF